MTSDILTFLPAPFDSIIPLAIVGQHKFYSTLSNFLGLIGYWASAFIALVMMEHYVIRKGRFESYDLRYWNNARKLTTGVPATLAVFCAIALIVPSMDQVWYTGPIAKTTGDIGFEVAMVITAICYVPMRLLELRYRKLV